MRMFSHGRPTRVIAQMVSLAFLLSVGMMGVPIPPTEAQISTRAAPTESVAVVPFDNRTRFRPETLGAEASQAVAVELRDRLLLDVLPAADVSLQMRDLGLVAPLSDAELIRLASELEVTMVVSGEVRGAGLMRDRAGTRAEIVLAVRLFDRVAEDAVNGAVVRAVGPAATDADENTLIAKALEQAAFQAVRDMRTRPSVVATVLWNRDDVVYMSVGSRAGLQPGMQMAVIRGSQRIALVEVTDADPLGAYARLLSGPALRPGDQLRAIYKLPTRVEAPSAEKVHQKKRNLETLLIGAGALLGLANVGSAARLIEEGNIAAPLFTASNLANGLEMGYVYYGAAAILLTWLAYDEPTEAARLVAFEVYGDGGFVDVLYLPSHENYYIHGPAPAGIYFDVLIEIDSVLGWPTLVYYTAEELDPENPPDTGITVGPYSIQYVWIPWGPAAGYPWVYRIRPVIADHVGTLAGLDEWQLKRDTELSTTENYVMAVSPPLSSGVQISGTIATFMFYSPVGADEAIVQIARDPYSDFPPDKIYSKVSPGLWTDQDLYSSASIPVDLNNVVSLPGSGNMYWWRIGARSRESRVAPRPWPTERVNDYGWVWSRKQRLTLLTPLTLDSGRTLHEQREALAKARSGRSRVLSRTRRERPVRVHR